MGTRSWRDSHGASPRPGRVGSPVSNGDRWRFNLVRTGGAGGARSVLERRDHAPRRRPVRGNRYTGLVRRVTRRLVRTSFAISAGNSCSGTGDECGGERVVDGRALPRWSGDFANAVAVIGLTYGLSGRGSPAQPSQRRHCRAQRLSAGASCNITRSYGRPHTHITHRVTIGTLGVTHTMNRVTAVAASCHGWDRSSHDRDHGRRCRRILRLET